MSHNKIYICENCELEKCENEMDYQFDTYWIPASKQELIFCIDCLSDMSEKAEEKRISDYYGSSEPQTQDEKYKLAQKIKYNLH